MTIYDELAAELSDFSKKKIYDYAILGYNIGGHYTVYVDNNSMLYHASTQDGTYIRVRHMGRVAPIPGARVKIYYPEDGDPIVESVDTNWLSQTYGLHSGSLLVGPHSHHLGSGLEFPVDWLLLSPLSPQIENGLNVKILSGYYYRDQSLRYFSSKSLDLSDYVPTTNDSQRWVVVSITEDDDLSVEVGTEISTRFPLTNQEVCDIMTPESHIRLFAVKLVTGMQQLSLSMFRSLLPFVRKQRQTTGAELIVTSEGSVVVSNGSVVTYGA